MTWRPHSPRIKSIATEPLYPPPSDPLLYSGSVDKSFPRYAIKKVLTKKQCRNICSEYDGKTSLREYKDGVFNRCNVPIDGEYGWLYQFMFNNMLDANKQFWDLDVHSIQEHLRFYRYDRNHYVNPHTDYSPWDRSKLTGSLLLSVDNTGGDLIINNGKFGDVRVHAKIGDLVVFPAYEIHSVSRIKRGCRNVLLGWVAGPRMR